MVDKLEAIRLRKMGKSYKSIAESVGCSEAWCKINLKGVKQEFAITESDIAVRDYAISVLEDALAKLKGIV